MRSLIVACLSSLAASVLGLLPIGTAVASRIPSPPLCTVPSPIVACPAGDVVYATIMRLIDNNPIAQPDVTISVENCSSIQVPPVIGDEGYQVVFVPNTQTPQSFQKTGNVNGETDFAIRAGGTCPASTVKIYGDGVLVALRALASFDQDGNLSVGPEDVAIATAKLGSSDPTADFDGDGTVTAADISILRAHLGHHAPGMATPVASRTWGTLKITYR